MCRVLSILAVQARQFWAFKVSREKSGASCARLTGKLGCVFQIEDIQRF